MGRWSVAKAVPCRHHWNAQSQRLLVREEEGDLGQRYVAREKGRKNKLKDWEIVEVYC